MLFQQPLFKTHCNPEGITHVAKSTQKYSWTAFSQVLPSCLPRRSPQFAVLGSSGRKTDSRQRLRVRGPDEMGTLLLSSVELTPSRGPPCPPTPYPCLSFGYFGPTSTIPKLGPFPLPLWLLTLASPDVYFASQVEESKHCSCNMSHRQLCDLGLLFHLSEPWFSSPHLTPGAAVEIR